MDLLMKYLIIGISGTTNAGKTTVVKKLKQFFPDAHTMCLDAYFLEPNDKRLDQYYVPEVDHCNWEQFGALDMERLIEDVERWKRQQVCSDSGSVPILIIEGFIIFNHSVLRNYFNKKYFLTLDKETCVARRSQRCYNPPDKPGYFEKVVWPMYLQNRQQMEEAQADIVYVDGKEDQDKIVQQITRDIKQLLKSCSS